MHTCPVLQCSECTSNPFYVSYDGKVLAFCYVYSQEAECITHINSRLAFGNPLNQGNQDIHFIEHTIYILGSFEIDNNSSQSGLQEQEITCHSSSYICVSSHRVKL